MPIGIYKREKENKGMFKKGHKGFTHWKGKKLPKETIEKMSKMRKGRKLSEETKRKKEV